MKKNNKISAVKTPQILYSILEVAPIGIYIVNKKGNIDYVNSSMILISGDSYEQFKSTNIFKIPIYKKLGLDKKIRDVFDGIPFSVNSVRYVAHYSGKMTIRNMIGIPLEELGQRKALVFVEDVTQIKEAEEALVRAMNIKSQFISLVSHELKTPFGIVDMSISSVLDGSAGHINDRQREYLEICKRHVDRLLRLAKNVLDFQKMEAGRMEFRMEEGDINSVAKEVAREMSPLAKNKKIEINLSLAEGIPLVTFDKDKIIQVLINLINNAIKFTDKGVIELSTSMDGKKIRVSVADTGMGIKEEDKRKLFRNFSQVGSKENRVPGGTGLGLVISKNIIEKHGSNIELRSEYGKGSVFSFCLPLKTEKRKVLL